MIKNKYLITFLCLIFIVQACKKEPNAGICVSNNSPFILDTVELTSCSKNTYNHIWILPDGSTSASQTLKFTSAKEGSFNIKLIAYTKNKKYSNTTSVNLNFSEPTGSKMFWTNKASDPISVIIYEIDGITVVANGTITSFFPTDKPECNTAGCYTVTLKSEKYYHYYASNSSYHWSNNFYIERNLCNKLELLQ